MEFLDSFRFRLPDKNKHPKQTAISPKSQTKMSQRKKREYSREKKSNFLQRSRMKNKFTSPDRIAGKVEKFVKET